MENYINAIQDEYDRQVDAGKNPYLNDVIEEINKVGHRSVPEHELDEGALWYEFPH